MTIELTIENPMLDDDDDATSKTWVPPTRTPEQRAELKRRKDEGELLPGAAPKKHPNDRKISNLTHKDLTVMAFLGRHKGASSNIMGVRMGVNRTTVHNRLDSLKRLGLVNYHYVGGETRYFWYLTPAGKRRVVNDGYALDYELSTDRPKRNYETDKHSLAVSMTAAHIIVGTPRKAPVDDRLVIGETAIRSKWQTALGGFTRSETFGKGGVGQALKIKMLNEVKTGQITWDQVLAAEPALWTLTGPLTDPKIENYHTPDMVLNCEAGRDEAPQSIAYEIELTQKSEEKYERTLTLYKQDTLVYSKVIWVCDDMNTYNALIRAAKKIRFPKDRLGFEWLRDASGKRLEGPVYNL